MLIIKRKRGIKTGTKLTMLLSASLFVGGLYLLSLVGAPLIMPALSQHSLDPSVLAKPSHDNRIIIPKIGVNIPYGQSEGSLDSGAWWRHPSRGNPKDGGNFIIAAHRFEIKPTPMETWKKSPFYQIDKLEAGDEIIVDYEGKRYGYKVATKSDVKPDQTEIESPSNKPKLTLYSCGLGGSKVDRIVIVGDPLGEVRVQQ